MSAEDMQAMDGIDVWHAVARELEAAGWESAVRWVRVRVQAKEIESEKLRRTPADERRIIAGELDAAGWGTAARWVCKRADAIDVAESLRAMEMEGDMSVRPVDVRIMCSVTDKGAFEHALAVFLDSQGLLPDGYIFSVRELDVPLIPVVRIEPEVQP